MSDAEIRIADLNQPDHQQAVLYLLEAFSRDVMGNGSPMAPAVRDRLIPGLLAHPTTLIFLAFLDEQPVGLAVCFRGFSTFAAKPLINIHDLVVLPGQRGHGIGKRLLAAVEAEARGSGCCKVTLEVQENNQRARKLYAAAGFRQATYAEAAGGSLALTKLLAPS
ncbi:MAG: GNAT family N-acetyltransferase [Desulfosarcinaceae bacterium]|nr:GNAT family N-acetyltransferase [Desulfosarcinaceae bacterium]